MRKVADIGEDIGAKTGKRNLRRSDHEHDAEHDQVQQIDDHDEGEKCSLIGKIGLIFQDHPAGKREMKRPGHPNERVEQPAVRLHVKKQTEQPVKGDRDQAVEREKVGRERDPKIVAIGNDVAAFASNAKTADAATHEIDPQRVGQFVTEDVKQKRSRQTEKCNQPQNRA